MSGCSSVRTYQVSSSHTTSELFYDAVMGPELVPQSFESVFTLSESQKDTFKKILIKPGNRTKLDIEIIYNYLHDRLADFNFYTKTLTAQEALQQNAGNCLSLAILTNALAKTTHVGVYYELARTPPVFQRENGYLMSSQHIQTVIYEKNVGNAIHYSSKPLKLKIDYYSNAGSRTLRRVSFEEFQAMYYSNVAAEALIQDRPKKAYWNLKRAIQIDPDNPIALNMLAVLYSGLGYAEYAEKVFVHGLSLADNQLELLSNYYHYLMNNGRSQEAKKVAVIIDDYNDPDPFKWVDLADQELTAGRYANAVKYFKKARKLAPYLHQPSAGLAKAYFYLGDYDKAISSIESALENSHSQTFDRIYRAKYDFFKSQSQSNKRHLN